MTTKHEIFSPWGNAQLAKLAKSLGKMDKDILITSLICKVKNISVEDSECGKQLVFDLAPWYLTDE